ncbi:phospholipase A2 inhibitor and Ly6/PLAUR domain-containing protein-like [Sphaerodactylus townsendi]|uniref:phospholipase A2 inhibitor and Ly6/PLAUR domain-containing protein-like n=1 Tax=Sphaerodactylus townsendi TaxID=933632 RepID=UPI002026921C|nr:phospholipase A2 inhibitor and Ly6/PLAUR domain-containing protein-like [Sphaerodactylus townsendi]
MAFLILFLFALLYVAARPAFTIQCRTCTGVNIECTGTLTTCSSEYDTCHLIFTEATLSGKTLKTTRRSCTTQKSCIPGDIFMHLANGYQETGQSLCCTTDDCNAANFTVPAWNEILNGKQCPSCSAESPNTCQQETINCMGSEDRCFTREIGSTIQKGCATRSFCANSFAITFSESLILSSQTIQCGNEDVPGITNTAPESRWLCLQIFSGFLIAKPFLQCFF